jgi:peptide/nickel transport system substrate-binding protein
VGRIGMPARGFIPPGLLGYEPGKALTPGAETEQPLKGLELSCLVNMAYEGQHQPVAGELYEIFQRKGIKISVRKTKEEDMNKAVAAASTDIFLERWIADYPDTDNFVGLLHSEKGFVGHYCGTPEIDRLVERGRIETRPEVRHDIYREIEHMIARRALMLPLFHEQTYRFARPEVGGFEIRLSYPAVPYEKLWIRR